VGLDVIAVTEAAYRASDGGGDGRRPATRPGCPPRGLNLSSFTTGNVPLPGFDDQHLRRARLELVGNLSELDAVAIRAQSLHDGLDEL